MNAGCFCGEEVFVITPPARRAGTGLWTGSAERLKIGVQNECFDCFRRRYFPGWIRHRHIPMHATAPRMRITRTLDLLRAFLEQLYRSD